jgi:hypothetical protein
MTAVARPHPRIVYQRRAGAGLNGGPSVCELLRSAVGRARAFGEAEPELSAVRRDNE